MHRAWVRRSTRSRRVRPACDRRLRPVQERHRVEFQLLLSAVAEVQAPTRRNAGLEKDNCLDTANALRLCQPFYTVQQYHPSHKTLYRFVSTECHPFW